MQKKCLLLGEGWKNGQRADVLSSANSTANSENFAFSIKIPKITLSPRKVKAENCAFERHS